MVDATEDSAVPELLDLQASRLRYQLHLEKKAGGPFFRVEDVAGFRIIHLNMLHRFYSDLYDGELSTPSSRLGLEMLLFSMADVILGKRLKQIDRYSKPIRDWSNRLDQALETLSFHMRAVEAREPEHGSFDFHSD